MVNHPRGQRRFLKHQEHQADLLISRGNTTDLFEFVEEPLDLLSPPSPDRGKSSWYEFL